MIEKKADQSKMRMRPTPDIDDKRINKKENKVNKDV